MKRWNGPISICIVLPESQVKELDEKLSPYMNRGIVFTFYIAKEYPDHLYHGYYIRNKEKGIVQTFSTMIYPVNFARDLAIESLSTTHYLFIVISLHRRQSIKTLNLSPIFLQNQNQFFSYQHFK